MPSPADFEIDLSEFMEAMQLYEEATGKDAADIVNKAAINMCIGGRGLQGALQVTEKGDKSSLVKFSPKGDFFTDQERYEHGLFNALAASGATKYGKVVKGKGNKKVALQIYNSRLRSFSYSRSVWIRIAQDFGAKLRTKFANKGGDPPKGTPAKPGIHPVAKVDSGSLQARHVENVMSKALQTGAKNAAKDMIDYAQKKLQKTADQYSAR